MKISSRLFIFNLLLLFMVVTSKDDILTAAFIVCSVMTTIGICIVHQLELIREGSNMSSDNKDLTHLPDEEES